MQQNLHIIIIIIGIISIIASIVASIVGMIIGRKLCARVPARTLQVGFASVCLVVAGYMLLRA